MYVLSFSLCQTLHTHILQIMYTGTPLGVLSHITMTLESMLKCDDKKQINAAVRVVCTAFECVYYGQPSKEFDVDACATWAKEAAEKTSKARTATYASIATETEIKRYDDQVTIMFHTINGGVSVTRRTLRYVQDSEFFSQILNQADELMNTVDDDVLKVTSMDDMSSETVKMMFDYIESKGTMQLNKLSAQNLFAPAVKFDLSELKAKCDSILTKNLNLDSAMKYLSIAILDGAFLQGTYSGMHLAQRCTSLVAENFVQASEIASVRVEMWEACVDFVLSELKRRLTHEKCFVFGV